MQDVESRPEQSSRVIAVNSSNWRSIVIAVVITAIITGTSGYLLGAIITQSLLKINVPNYVPTANTLPTKKPSAIPFVPKTVYPVPPTNPAVTANWKLYKSENYSFAFLYPPHMYAITPPYPTTMHARYSDNVMLSTKLIIPQANVIGEAGGYLFFLFVIKTIKMNHLSMIFLIPRL